MPSDFALCAMKEADHPWTGVPRASYRRAEDTNWQKRGGLFRYKVGMERKDAVKHEANDQIQMIETRNGDDGNGKGVRGSFAGEPGNSGASKVRSQTGTWSLSTRHRHLLLWPRGCCVNLPASHSRA